MLFCRFVRSRWCIRFRSSAGSYGLIGRRASCPDPVPPPARMYALIFFPNFPIFPICCFVRIYRSVFRCWKSKNIAISTIKIKIRSTMLPVATRFQRHWSERFSCVPNRIFTPTFPIACRNLSPPPTFPKRQNARYRLHESCCTFCIISVLPNESASGATVFYTGSFRQNEKEGASMSETLKDSKKGVQKTSALPFMP